VGIHGPITPEFAQILTPEAVAFCGQLCSRFETAARSCLPPAPRGRRSRRGPRCRTSCRRRRASAVPIGRFAPQPADMLDRRVEITGPTDRKMVINALNCGASVFMADFEDADTPTWHNMVDGQINVRDAVRRTITLDRRARNTS